MVVVEVVASAAVVTVEVKAVEVKAVAEISFIILNIFNKITLNVLLLKIIKIV